MHFYGTKVENRTNKTQRIMAKLDYNGLSNTVIQMAYKLSYIIFHYYICKKTFHFRISFGLECVRIFCFHIVKEKISLYKTFLCHQRRTLKRFLILPLPLTIYSIYIELAFCAHYFYVHNEDKINLIHYYRVLIYVIQYIRS